MTTPAAAKALAAAKAAAKALAAQEEKTFNTYTSAKQSFVMTTHKGRKIQVLNFKYITDNKEEIEYLDSEIDAGFALLAKGEAVTAEDANPMEALRKSMRAEVLKELTASSQAKQLPPSRTKEDTSKLGAVSSQDLAAISQGSAATG